MKFHRINKTEARKNWKNLDRRLVIVGNNVNPEHIFKGWKLGYEPSEEARTQEDFDTVLNNFLFYLEPELGRYAHFYLSNTVG